MRRTPSWAVTSANGSTNNRLFRLRLRDISRLQQYVLVRGAGSMCTDARLMSRVASSPGSRLGAVRSGHTGATGAIFMGDWFNCISVHP